MLFYLAQHFMQNWDINLLRKINPGNLVPVLDGISNSAY